MQGKTVKEISYDGDDLQPITNVDNEGWAEELPTPSGFRGRRAHAPDPLSGGDTDELIDRGITYRAINVSVAKPGFDSGLGCFGNSSKLVETGKGELDDLYWPDFHEVRTAADVSEGRRRMDTDEWIRFQRLTQRKPEPKSEEELKEFHKIPLEKDEEARKAIAQNLASKSKELLTEAEIIELELLEDDADVKSSSAFRDWIEEADLLEAGAGMSEETPHDDDSQRLDEQQKT